QRQSVMRKPAAIPTPDRESGDKTSPAKPKVDGKVRKLSYKEQRELEALPIHIEALETEQAQLQQQTADPGYYQRPADEIAAGLARLESLAVELADCYARWEALESASD
ncbi:MAG TPA: ABC transporter ATP-binding protein, partial [Gammaproteobacteria bacterium]|nr:ABC transporter ATP-binding protein [Gammaproteobacteria bacterium]